MMDVTTAAGPDFGFGLYVHWPYCTRICPYCDFNVYTAKGRDNSALVDAIIADIDRHYRRMGDHPKLDSLFLGGGTPSLLSAAQMAEVIDAAHARFGLREGAEITLEANPNDVLAGDLPGWRAAGVNRLSVGVQSLDDDALKFLGRDHDSANALRAIDLTAATFPNHSVDLIYARPGQSAEAWSAELGRVITLGAPHLSLYELTIEARTAFGKRAARGDLIAMEDDAQADMYEATQAITSAAGLPAYEVSNHARDAASRSVHNTIYWHGGDWIGVGPGAHGRITVDGQRLATEAAKRPADYISQTKSEETALPALDIARELFAMGLRPVEGIDISRVENLAGSEIDRTQIATLEAAGMARLKGTTLSLTPSGWLLADRIAAELSP